MGYLDGARVLDLFAGSGALGLEALSRGASHTTFVEKNFKVSQVLRQNILECGVSEDSYRILKRDVRTVSPPGHEERYDLIFMDPPYEKGWLEPVLREVARYDWLRADGRIIVDHSKRDVIPDGMGWCVDERRVYGDVAIAWVTLREGENAHGQ